MQVRWRRASVAIAVAALLAACGSAPTGGGTGAPIASEASARTAVPIPATADAQLRSGFTGPASLVGRPVPQTVELRLSRPGTFWDGQVVWARLTSSTRTSSNTPLPVGASVQVEFSASSFDRNNGTYELVAIGPAN